MNISSLYPVYIAPTRPESPSSTQKQTDESDRPQLRIVRDKVVISYSARTLLDEMRQMPGVDMSIKTLLGTAPLTEERATEVIERIDHGYYRQPEILKEVAGVLSSALETDL